MVRVAQIQNLTLRHDDQKLVLRRFRFQFVML